MNTFIVQSRGANPASNTVVAPTGYHRLSDGTIKRDGTPSPEMGSVEHAYRFNTYRSAARTASTLANGIIRES